MAAAHQLGEYPLRKYRVGKIETGELVLVRPGGDGKILEKPIVQRAMILEFEGTDRMRYVLDGVGLSMRKIVAWINAPCRSGARMAGMQNAIEHRVAQINVPCTHI